MDDKMFIGYNQLRTPVGSQIELRGPVVLLALSRVTPTTWNKLENLVSENYIDNMHKDNLKASVSG